MDIKFIKEQFEIAKNVSHLSETVVIDIKTLEWLIQRVEGLGKECFKAYTEKNLLENKFYDLRTKLQEDIEIKEKLIGTLRTSNRNYQIAFDNVCEEYQPLTKEKSEFVKWLKGHSDDLSLMKNIYSMGEDKERLYKIMGQMEMILEVLNYFNKKS